MKIILNFLVFIFLFSSCSNKQTQPVGSGHTVYQKKSIETKNKKSTTTNSKQIRSTKQDVSNKKRNQIIHNKDKLSQTQKQISTSSNKPIKSKPKKLTNEVPLNKEYAKLLQSIPNAKLGVVNEHYYISNETRYDLWYKYIKNLGGVYMGVGADQNYSLAAITNPELVILMDYDKEVVYLHKMYKIIVKKAENPAQVLELLKRKHNKEIYEEALNLYDKKTAKWIKAIHKGSGNFILKHFKYRFKQHKKYGFKFWLSDPTIYAKWRSLVLNNRVWEFGGDLTKAVTMNNISSILKKMNKKMRVMYFSNAEEFWSYKKPFRQAIINMPFDDKSMIIRSVVIGKKYKIGWKFHYTIQTAFDFVSWMKYKGYFSIKSIARRYRVPLEKTLYLSKLPAAPTKPDKI